MTHNQIPQSDDRDHPSRGSDGPAERHNPSHRSAGTFLRSLFPKPSVTQPVKPFAPYREPAIVAELRSYSEGWGL